MTRDGRGSCAAGGADEKSVVVYVAKIKQVADERRGERLAQAEHARAEVAQAAAAEAEEAPVAAAMAASVEAEAREARRQAEEAEAEAVREHATALMADVSSLGGWASAAASKLWEESEL